MFKLILGTALLLALASSEASACKIVLTGEIIHTAEENTGYGEPIHNFTSVQLSAVDCPSPPPGETLVLTWSTGWPEYMEIGHGPNVNAQMGSPAFPYPGHYDVVLSWQESDATQCEPEGCVAGSTGQKLFVSRKMEPPVVTLGGCQAADGRRKRQVTIFAPDPDPAGEPGGNPVSISLNLQEEISKNKRAKKKAVKMRRLSDGTFTGTIFFDALKSYKLTVLAGNVYSGTSGGDPHGSFSSAKTEVAGISCGNTPPEISFVSSGGIITTPNINTALTYSDADQDPLKKVFWQLTKPSGSNVTIPAETGSGGVPLGADVPGFYTVTARASDGYEDSNTASLTVRYNRQPVPGAIEMSPGNPVVGSPIDFSLTSTDADGDSLSTTWAVEEILEKGEKNKSIIQSSTGETFSWTGTTPGNYKVTAFVTDHITPPVSRSNTFIVSPTSAAEFDFELKETKVAQAVFHAEDYIRLVRNKPVVVRAVITSKLPIPAGSNEDVVVKALFKAGDQSFPMSQMFNTSKLAARPVGTEIVVDLSSTNSFDVVGSGVIEVEVNPIGGKPESIRDNNKWSGSFSSSMTAALNLKYYLVQPNCSGGSPCFRAPNPDQSNFIIEASDFIKGMYPISELNVDPMVSNIDGEPNFTGLNVMGADAMKLDLLNVGSLFTSGSSKNRIAGIVSGPVTEDDGPGYFSYHGFGEPNPVFGYQPTGLFSRAFLVQEGYAPVAAHELGHSFNLLYDNFPDITHDPDENSTDGYWTEKNEFRQGKYTFMTKSPTETNGALIGPWWINNFTYSRLFDKFTLGTPQARRAVNQEVLYVNGILSSDGDFISRNAISGHVSNLELVPAGTGKAILKDPNGVELAEAFFDSAKNVELIGSNGANIVPVSSVPISFVVPFDQRTAIIEVFDGEVRIAGINPNSELLRDAVQRIPDTGFYEDPAFARGRLLELVAEFERFLIARSYLSSRTHLKEIVRSRVMSDVIQEFTKSSPMEVTGREVLEVIDKILDRVDAQRAIIPQPQNILLRMTLDRDIFLINERLNVQLDALKPLSNSELEYHVELKLNGQVQNITKKTGAKWIASTSRIGAGINSLTAQLVIQPKRESRNIELSIEAFRKSNDGLARRMVSESDPEIIESIQIEIFRNDEKIGFLKNQLNSIRKNVGDALESKFSAN